MLKQNNNNLSASADEKNMITSFWQSRAKNFAEARTEELHSEKYDQWKNEILSQLPSDKGLKILDIGCGTGFFTIILCKCGMDMTGIDLTPEMISEAKHISVAEGIKANFQVMDAEKLDFHDNTFDAVISRNVTWNLPHPDVAYREWIRVLKPGGVLINVDAEYAKHHNEPLPEQSVHLKVTDKDKENCNEIYDSLAISKYNRPSWDIEILKALGVECTVDFEINKRIYDNNEKFYFPAPLFLIKGKK